MRMTAHARRLRAAASRAVHQCGPRRFGIVVAVFAIVCALRVPTAFAATATLNWSINAVATETVTSSGSASASARDDGYGGGCYEGFVMPSPYSGCYQMVPINCPYNATGTCNYDWVTGGSGSPWAIAQVTLSATVPNDDDIAGLEGAGSQSGTFTFQMNGGQTYYLYAFHRGSQGRTDLDCSWTGTYSHPITGQDAGGNTFELRAGEHTITNYSLNWSGALGGSRVITSFSFNPSASFTPALLAPRLSWRPDPTYSQSGAIKVTFDNTQPTTPLVSPSNGSGIEDSTPLFTFDFSDPDSDDQQIFQLQIATDASFQNLVHDTGSVSSSATSYQLPAGSALIPQTTYYWRVRTRDVYAGTGEWGSYSPVWSFTNTMAPDLALMDGATEIPQSGAYDFGDVDYGGLATAILSLDNAGSADLQIDSVTVSTPDTFYVLEPLSFPVSIAPGSGVALRLSYVPADIGTHTAIVQIASNDPDEGLFVLNLTGNAYDWVFRYQSYLYSRSGEYIYGKLEDMSQYWGDLERDEAQSRLEEFALALQSDPFDSARRWVLLDVYYDIALAELLVAQEKTIGALKSSLGIEPSIGVPAVATQIELLEEARTAFERGLAVYFDLLQDPLGIDTSTVDPEVAAGTPFGYYVFAAEVPSRSLYSPLRRDAAGDYVLPGEDDDGTTPVIVHESYKDLMLLLELEKEHVRTTSRLVGLYLLSDYADGSGAEALASDMIGETLRSSHMEVEILLNAFDIDFGAPDWSGAPEGMQQIVEAWEVAMSELTHYQSYVDGTTDPLGFPHDILVLIQSQIPGDPTTEYFHSYDFLAAYLTDTSASGPLAVAMSDWSAAIVEYDSYRDRQDTLALHLSQSREQFGERLRRIVGVDYGEEGYDDLFGHSGSELSQQSLQVALAEARLTSLETLIRALNDQIVDAITQRGEIFGIHDAIRQVYLDYGEQRALLGEQSAAIAGALTFLESDSENPRRSAIARLAELQAMKEVAVERLAAQEKADVSTLEDGLLDIETAKTIKALALSMQSHYLDAIEAAITISIENGRLDALLSEKASLEKRWIEYDADLAQRYFADPAHRLLRDLSFNRAELSFERAQRWIALTAKALEYKWNTPFDHFYGDRQYTADTVFELCNARELTDMFAAMSDWNAASSIGPGDDNGYKQFSFRRDFLGLGNDYAAFQDYLTTEAVILEADDPDNKMSVRALRLEFNTVREETSFFRQERWLEKIDFLRVKVLGGVLSGVDDFIDGYLVYGGTSYLRDRTPGVPDPLNPDRVIGEMTAYPVRYLYFDPATGWRAKDELGSYVSAQVTLNPDVPTSAYQINTFQQLAVAGSDWTLYLALEDPDGDPVVNLGNVVDIEIHFAMYWHNRVLP